MRRREFIGIIGGGGGYLAARRPGAAADDTGNRRPQQQFARRGQRPHARVPPRTGVKPASSRVGT